MGLNRRPAVSESVEIDHRNWYGLVPSDRRAGLISSYQPVPRRTTRSLWPNVARTTSGTAATSLRSLQLQGFWSPKSDSNRRPAVYKTAALTN